MESELETSLQGECLQERYSPGAICFGCGPKNPDGLHVRSFPAQWSESGRTDLVVCRWIPQKKYEAFPAVINGGIIGALLDCHSNWTAAYHLMKRDSMDHAPCTVTADFHVKLRRPTPSDGDLLIKAWVAESGSDRALIQAEILGGGKVCATCEGNFVSVKPGHPAYHRW